MVYITLKKWGLLLLKKFKKRIKKYILLYIYIYKWFVSYNKFKSIVTLFLILDNFLEFNYIKNIK